jgi:hypothetical protein
LEARLQVKLVEVSQDQSFLLISFVLVLAFAVRFGRVWGLGSIRACLHRIDAYQQLVGVGQGSVFESFN